MAVVYGSFVKKSTERIQILYNQYYTSDIHHASEIKVSITSDNLFKVLLKKDRSIIHGCSKVFECRFEYQSSYENAYYQYEITPEKNCDNYIVVKVDLEVYEYNQEEHTSKIISLCIPTFIFSALVFIVISFWKIG